MTTLVATGAAILLLTGSAVAQSTMPNLSGTWTIDIAKSDFGPAPPPDSVVMVIDHKEPTIKSRARASASVMIFLRVLRVPR